jgi:hypothetical protein
MRKFAQALGNKDSSVLGSQKSRIVALTLLASVAVVFFFWLTPPIAQEAAYHQFADSRGSLGIPNLANVLSNLAFVAVGLWGLSLCQMGKLVHDNEKKYPVYALFFAAVALTGLGSSYYHWGPNNSTLVWDRLPMALSFTAFTVAVLSEHMKRGVERWLLYPLLSVGVFSVIYWYVTESHGQGDLRFYALVQFLPVLMIPLVCIMFQSRFTRHVDIYLVLGCYGLAMLAEHFDKAIFSLTSTVSGHTLKHLLAALGVFWVIRMLRLRRTRPEFLGRTAR